VHGRNVFVLVAATVAIWVSSPVAALAAGCPGDNVCPYAAAAIIGQRAEGVLRFPEAITVDAQGNVYVADQLSNVVQHFSPTGTFLGEFGGYGSAAGEFGPVGGLALDAAGDVFVVDSLNDRIEKFNAAGQLLTMWGSKGSGIGQFSFGASPIPGDPPGGGIAVIGDYVFVADTGNDRIERFDLNGGSATAFGEPGDLGGQLDHPHGLAADGAALLVADDDNDRIDRFDLNGNYLGSSGSLGAAGSLANPYGVAVGAAGDVYVADNNNNRIVALSAALGFQQPRPSARARHRRGR